MKAVIMAAHGGIEVLDYTDVVEPEPGPGMVLVRLRAAALNRVDLWVREGWPGIRLELPHILGADGAGEVAALGQGVSGWSSGERVVINSNFSCGRCDFCRAGYDNRCRRWELLGETLPGTYAEYVAVPETNLLRMPESITDREAAAAALVFHTAWHSLIQRGGLRPGESVLVVGASGGVNSASIQIARLAGAIVYVVGSSRQKLALAEALGAHHLIDRSIETDWAKTIYRMTDKTGVDVVVDNVGTTFLMSMRAAKRGGRILTVGNTGGARFEFDNRYMFGKHLALIGSTMGTRSDFNEVMSLVFQRRLKPVLDEDFALPDAARAHTYLETGKQLGKLTLSIS